MAHVHRIAAVALALVAGCATTTIVSSWKDPAARAVQLRRVVVMAPSNDSALRRSIEDELAQRIPNATPSYRLFADSELQNRQLVRDEVKARGYDGLVSFRIVSVDQQTIWAPGAYWGPAYAYGGWPMFDPGYLATQTLVRVDTDVYDLDQDKLVWAAASRTYDPRSVRTLVDDVTKAVARRMRKEGLAPRAAL
jgi:hypothetical protein